MEQIKVFLITVVCIVTFIALGLALDFGDLQWFKFIEPKKEDARHKVFKATRSYNEAKMQELVKYRLEYLREKDEDSKNAIAGTIRHMFSEYDENQLPPELKSFVKKIKYGEY